MFKMQTNRRIMTTLAYLMCIQAPITTERNFPIYNNQVLNLQSETEVAVFKFKFKKTSLNISILQTLWHCSGAICITTFHYVFTALHVMQRRYCDENSVRPSHACIVTKR